MLYVPTHTFQALATPQATVERDTPGSCDLDSSLQSKPDTMRSQDDMDGLDEEAPLKPGSSGSKSSRSSMKSMLCEWERCGRG